MLPKEQTFSNFSQTFNCHTEISLSKLVTNIVIFLLFLSVFAQELDSDNNSMNMTEVKTTEKLSDVVSQFPTLWNVGIFAIIGGAITFIGILLTIRFLHIDKTYEEKLRTIRDDTENELEKQEKLFDQNQFKKENVRWFAEYISSFFVALEDVKQRRKDNRQTGLIIDVICMGLLFVLGAIATTGFFQDKFIFLLILTGTVAFFPVTHFVNQLRRIKYEIPFNRQ